MKNRSEIPTTRKAGAYSEVNTCVVANDERLAGLPVLLSSDLHDESGDDSILMDFKKGTPQFFILDAGRHGHFFIDTQGYNYARYASRVMSAPGITAAYLSDYNPAQEGIDAVRAELTLAERKAMYAKKCADFAAFIERAVEDEHDLNMGDNFLTECLQIFIELDEE